MRLSRLAPALLLVGVAGSLAAHDMFIKLDRYRVPPNTAFRAPLINGTFSKSENAIAADRVADVSLVSPAGRAQLDLATVSGRNDTTWLALRTGGPGTYVVGFSTKPTQFRLSGKEFAGYLEEEGLTDVLAQRQQAGTMADSAGERYSKHVKAIFQVGDQLTETAQAALGYPAEIVPLDNPYAIKPGGMLRVRCLARGMPVANVAVLSGGRSPRGARLPQRTVRSDADGIATISLDQPGKYYVKFIRMVPVTDPGVDYESLWATLTFEVGGR